MEVTVEHNYLIYGDLIRNFQENRNNFPNMCAYIKDKFFNLFNYLMYLLSVLHRLFTTGYFLLQVFVKSKLTPSNLFMYTE